MPLKCLRCETNDFNRYGTIRFGKQRVRCFICGRRFTKANNPRIGFERINCTKCGPLSHTYTAKPLFDVLLIRNYRAYLKGSMDDKGGAMISSSYNLDEFAHAIMNKTYYEVISLADREIMDAWRKNHRRDRSKIAVLYQKNITLFVEYLKSDLPPPYSRHIFPESLYKLREKLQAGKPRH